MAFDLNQFIKDQSTALKTPAGGFDVDKFVQEQTQGFSSSKTGGFNLNKFLLEQGIQPKIDLKTSAGLQEQVDISGLGGSGQRVLAGKGEHPKQIFSGGVISDIFDVLNSLSYGTVGVLKGEGFAQGVKNRESFSDKDSLGQYGVLGTIAGIALDIAVDPLTWISPAAVFKLIPGASKGLRVAGEVLSKTKVGEKLGSMFIYRFGQDPVYKAIAEATERKIAVSAENIMDATKGLRSLDPEIRKAITTTNALGQTIRKPIEQIISEGGLPKDLIPQLKVTYDYIDNLSEQMVQLGILPESIRANLGTYLKNSFQEFEAGKKIPSGFATRPKGIDANILKARKDIPDEIREGLGQIMDAGYILPDTLIRMVKTVENTKFFNEVGTKFASDIATEGMTQLPKVARLGSLAGKYVPDPIYRDLQEIIRQKTPIEESLGKVVAGFKFGKVVLNPATHARNVISNFLLNNFEGLSPARLDIYAEAANDLAKKGKWYQEAKAMGLGLDTYAAAELKDILLDPSASTALSKMGLTARNVATQFSNIYQKEEEWAKLAQYIYQRKLGKGTDEAWKVAERATFNYAQVTPFIRRLRENIFGFPFITFTYKVTPQIAKTLAKNPTKISNIGKIKQAIENQTDLKELIAERGTEPDWVRDGFYMKVPIKDKHGRSVYLDLTYILPFGDLMSGQLLERPINRETGLPEGAVPSALRKSPALNLIAELARNQDFYGNKIWLDSDPQEKQLGDLMRHMVKTYAPPLVADQIPGGYRTGGERRPGTIQRALTLKPGDIESGGLQSRTLTQELLRMVGIKTAPVNLETQAKFSETERRRALETLLLEQGKAAKFQRTFIPK